MKLLITGSAGFVGKSFARYAASLGHQVAGVSRSSQPQIDWPGEHIGVDVAQADLSTIISEIAPDAILHAAGSASVGASILSPFDDFRAGVQSWINLLDSVRRSGKKPTILFPSSAAIYGNPTSLPVREEVAAAPISPYGFHKLICEVIAREYSQCFKLNIIVARIFSLFGPRQRRLLVWELYKQTVSHSDTIQLEGTGHETRDYLHIDDFAAAILSLLIDGRPGIINVARGTACSVIELAELLQKLLGTKKRIHCHNRSRPGDPVMWRADISELSSRLGGRAVAQPLSMSVAQCVEIWQSEKNSY